jgi:hypothetical protein
MKWEEVIEREEDEGDEVIGREGEKKKKGKK